MKRLALLLMSVNTFASAVSVGPTGDYSTIALALSAVGNGNHTITVNGDYAGAENITVSNSGSSAALPLIIKSQSGYEQQVTVKRLSVTGDYLVLDGLRFNGLTNHYYHALTIGTGVDSLVVTNCFFEDMAYRVQHIGFTAIAGHDPDSEAKQVTITGCTFDNEGNYAATVSRDGEPMTDVRGTFNTYTNCTWRYSGGADAVRMWGRSNTVTGSVFTRIEEVSWSGNHADVVQTFGNNGEESSFMNFSHNFAYDCGKTYGTDCQIAMLAADTGGDPSLFGGWKIHNNIFSQISFPMRVALTNIVVANNTFYEVGFTNASEQHAVVVSGSADKGWAGNVLLENNAFILCGATNTATKGWYEIVSGTFNVTNDFNLVTKASWGAATGFSEPNGVNGGDPAITLSTLSDAAAYYIADGSVAIDAGTDLSSYFTTDITGATRSGTWDIGAYEYSGTDTTPPAFSSASVATDGTTLTVVFGEATVVGSGGSGGMTISVDGGGAQTATYSSGSGTTSLVYTVPTVYSGETVTVSYTNPGDGLEDAAGNDVGTISAESVTNSSTQTEAPAASGAGTLRAETVTIGAY